MSSAMHTLHHDCDEISDQGVPIIDLYLSLFYSFTLLSQGQQEVVAYYTVTKLITVRLLCHSVSLWNVCVETSTTLYYYNNTIALPVDSLQ